MSSNSKVIGVTMSRSRMFEAAATQELCDTLLHRHQELLFSGLRNDCVSVAVMFV